MSIIILVWLLFYTLVASTTDINAYSLEIYLQYGTKEPELWPIVIEDPDPGAFKAGSLSHMSTIRQYARLLLTPYGQVKTPNGNSTGFDKSGNWGIEPSHQKSTIGYAIIDSKLSYNGSINWTACPLKRDDATVYTIRWKSTCKNGFNTTISVVDCRPIEVTNSISDLTRCGSQPTTTLNENSFKSSLESQTADSSSSTCLLFSLLLALLLGLFYGL